VPKVLVHGVPETRALWHTLIGELEKRGIGDVTLLSPPGFGAPVPVGWEPTQANYTAWLVDELESLGGDVDLVGHDWGAGHTLGVLAARPDLLRSWASDCAGLIHPDYVWHDLAQVWQTAEAGEQAVATIIGAGLAERIEALTGLGVPSDIASEIAPDQNGEMARCILALYRSAAQPAMHELGQRLLSTEQRPGLVIVPTEDPFAGTSEMAEEAARGLGARSLTLEGHSHWWMFEGAAAVADALVTHWEAA